jgi:predicted nucleotidyltransferase
LLRFAPPMMAARKSPNSMNPVRERAIARLRQMVLDALDGHDAAVWLVGSCARGDERHPDDIDIAIFRRDDFPAGFFAKFAADFEESTIPYDLDLIDLREAGPALLDEVLWTGIRWRD